MRKIALPCYSLRWRLRLVRKAWAHSLSLLELAVAVKHVKWALFVQPNSSMFQIFGYGQPNPSLGCTGAMFTLNNTTMCTATTIIITCSGTSQIDGTPYTLYETVNYAWSKPPYYSKYMFQVSSGKMKVNASDATLHGLGLPGY